MYPLIEIFGIQIYTFGIILACAWFLFFILLHRFSLKNGIVRPIFGDIVTFTISLFFFSRLFHIFTNWVNEKFILLDLVHGNILGFLKLFFTPVDYAFSLSGAFFGFFLVFFIKTKWSKTDREKYLEAIVFAFLWASLLGYFGALLGGQMYGIPFASPVSIVYDNPDSIVQERSALFPLPVFYMIMTGLILLGLRKFGIRFSLPHGYLGFMGLGLISLLFFFGEFLSGKREEIFYDITLSMTGGIFGLSLDQIGALIGIIVAIIGLIRLTEKQS